MLIIEKVELLSLSLIKFVQLDSIIIEDPL